jgi:hypothetical protein
MITDIAMTVILPLLMAYSLIGEQTHEILGVCMFALFIVHHVINRKWWSSLFRGKYNAQRILGTVVNLLLAVFMILQPASGILMSKYVLKSITIKGTAATMRTIHMTLAYWGFAFMSFHLGLHVKNVTGGIVKKMNRTVAWILRILFIVIAGYGCYAFMKRGIGDYMLMKTMFAFFDPGEARVWFFMDYIAVMILFANLAYWIQNGLIRISRNSNGRQQPKTNK